MSNTKKSASEVQPCPNCATELPVPKSTRSFICRACDAIIKVIATDDGAVLKTVGKSVEDDPNYQAYEAQAAELVAELDEMHKRYLVEMSKKPGPDKPAETSAQRSENFPSRPDVGAPRPGTGREHAVIGASIHIDGDVRGEEDLLIEGEVNGTVQLKNNSLTIGPQGKVRADVYAHSVYVDGYFAGTVNDFDGFSQALRLEEGPYTIEIRAPGYAPRSINVRIQPGRKITFEGDLKPE